MKVNENGTLLKVKCLILLNIFSVFPTHVGMFLKSASSLQCSRSLPHACGDVPVPADAKFGSSLASSPRMWGYYCFQSFMVLFSFASFFCGIKGVFQAIRGCMERHKNFLPHDSGDVQKGSYHGTVHIQKRNRFPSSETNRGK